MIVSVKPAGSVAAFAVRGKHKKYNEAASRRSHPGNRRFAIVRILGTPTAEENFMLISETQKFQSGDAASAAWIGAGH
jgi:hypothetical protein